eukprot:g16717.t1
MSLSLQLPEHIIEEPSTTSTPCGGTSFSTLQVCSSSPLILLARATSSGLVELLALDTPDAHLFVHTRSLLAAIDVSSSCSSSCSSSTVTTLAETRSDEMDFVSWTVLESGLGDRTSRTEDSAPDRRNASMHFSKQSPLDLLEQPIASFGATPPQTAEKPLELATRVAGLRGGLASIACRQELLKHLLDVDTSELLRRSGAGKQRAKQLLERQKELVERQEALVKALRAAAESSSLESFKDWPGRGFLGKGKSKRPTGPHLPRTRVSSEPMRGEVLEWKSKFGWIKAHSSIDHPLLEKHRGKIYVNVIDLLNRDSLAPGDTCEFQLFSDVSGLGAEECWVLGGDDEDDWSQWNNEGWDFESDWNDWIKEEEDEDWQEGEWPDEEVPEEMKIDL